MLQIVTYLIMQEPLLHTVVCTNLLQDVPCKLAVKLIGKVPQRNGRHTNDGRDRNEERPRQRPEVVAQSINRKGLLGLQLRNRRVNLIDLDDCVDEQSQVRDAKPDDLN